MESIKQTIAQEQDLSDPSLARIPAALSEAQRELASLAFKPDSRESLAAAQLRLILTRIQRGIPPGGASLRNLIALLAGVSEQVEQQLEAVRE